MRRKKVYKCPFQNEELKSYKGKEYQTGYELEKEGHSTIYGSTIHSHCFKNLFLLPAERPTRGTIQAGIGRPLSKGTKLIHLERIIRFLINKLEQPSSLDERDEEMDSLMCQFLNSINAPKDPSNDLTGRESSSEKHIFVKPKCS